MASRYGMSAIIPDDNINLDVVKKVLGVANVLRNVGNLSFPEIELWSLHSLFGLQDGKTWDVCRPCNYGDISETHLLLELHPT